MSSSTHGPDSHLVALRFLERVRRVTSVVRTDGDALYVCSKTGMYSSMYGGATGHPSDDTLVAWWVDEHDKPSRLFCTLSGVSSQRVRNLLNYVHNVANDTWPLSRGDQNPPINNASTGHETLFDGKTIGLHEVWEIVL